MPDEKIVFEVYALDVYQEDGCWIENERHRLGKMEVLPALGREIDTVEILSAMAQLPRSLRATPAGAEHY